MKVFGTSFRSPIALALDGLGILMKKPRTIQLLPQALRVLRSLPVKEETWGLMNLGNDAVWKKRTSFSPSGKR